MSEGQRERRLSVRAGAGDAGRRLDRVLAAAASGLSRSRLKALILDGRVASAGRTISDPDYRVKFDQTFAIIVPEAVSPVPQGQDIALAIVFEDEDLIVVDKPAGLVVHPAPGNPDRTLVNALIAHCGEGLSGIGGVRRPGIVHRLDKGTSGLMVAAKHDRAHAQLVRQFAGRRVARAYTALAWGVPSPRRGEISGAIGRNPRNRKKMAVVSRGGRPALTRYRVERDYGGAASRLECRLATGRTHQIRVHLAWRGHAVIGDRTYGRVSQARLAALPPAVRAPIEALGRQALHAHLIGFEHPISGESLTFRSRLPADIEAVAACLEDM